MAVPGTCFLSGCLIRRQGLPRHGIHACARDAAYHFLALVSDMPRAGIRRRHVGRIILDTYLPICAAVRRWKRRIDTVPRPAKYQCHDLSQATHHLNSPPVMLFLASLCPLRLIQHIISSWIHTFERRRSLSYHQSI